MRGGPELSTEDSPKPTCSMESVEPSNAREETRALPIGEGTSDGVATASSKLVFIIL